MDAVRRWLHVREQDRRHRKRIQRPVQGRRLHRRGPGALHPDVRRELAGPRRGRREGCEMTSTLDRPVKVTTFQGVSLRRKVANNVATVLVTLSLLIALVPLLWVLYSVITKGVKALTSPVWFTHSQAGMTAFSAGGGVYHAVIGTLL